MATTETDPSVEMDAAMASADLLGQIAPPLRIRGGPDFILFERAPGPTPVAGATLWLQNPTNAPMEVRAWIAFDSAPAKVAVPDRFVGTLAPLRGGRARCPGVDHVQGAVRAQVRSDGPLGGSQGPSDHAGHLDREATAKGILFGLAGVALTGVGHFRVTHVGGDVGSGFSASWDFSGADPAIVGAEATWTRVWAPSRHARDRVHTQRRATKGDRDEHEDRQLCRRSGGIRPRHHRVQHRGSRWSCVPAIVLAAIVFIASGYGDSPCSRLHCRVCSRAEVIGSLVLRDGAGVTRA